eukprot:PhM_4_TR9544/c0_g1_i1/m.5171
MQEVSIPGTTHQTAISCFCGVDVKDLDACITEFYMEDKRRAQFDEPSKRFAAWLQAYHPAAFRHDDAGCRSWLTTLSNTYDGTSSANKLNFTCKQDAPSTLDADEQAQILEESMLCSIVATGLQARKMRL